MLRHRAAVEACGGGRQRVVGVGGSGGRGWQQRRQSAASSLIKIT